MYDTSIVSKYCSTIHPSISTARRKYWNKKVVQYRFFYFDNIIMPLVP